MASTNPKLSRVKYAAMLLGAAFTLVASTLQFSAVATAQPNDGAWDVIAFDDCLKKYNPGQAGSEEEMEARIKWCCLDTGGVWKDNGSGTTECVAPSDSSGSQQLPGNVHIPSDLATAPTLTKEPPRPIQVPSDLASVSAVSQAPA